MPGKSGTGYEFGSKSGSKSGTGYEFKETGESVTGESATGSHPPEIPILSPISERYVLLEEAIEAGEAVVEEVDEGGEVPFLGVKNSCIKPILIPEGEILVGAKQNRTVDITVLVAAGVKFTLPVSCVEKGRWRYKSRQFRAESYAHPRLREKKLRSAQRNRALGYEARSDQGEVWGEVDMKLHEMNAFSPTSDLVEASQKSDRKIEDYRRTIELPDGSCGFVAARGREIVGLDLFDSPVTMKKLWKRLGDSYFVGALGETDEPLEATRDLAEEFLASVVEKLSPALEQPELGVELELASEEISGTALWHDGAVCHLAAFPVEKPSVRGDDYGFGMAR
jgi:hypothetical protein